VLCALSVVREIERADEDEHGGGAGAGAEALCAKMSETVAPPEITEEGETG